MITCKTSLLVALAVWCTTFCGKMQYFKGKLPRRGPLIPQICTICRCGFWLSIDLIGRRPLSSHTTIFLLVWMDIQNISSWFHFVTKQQMLLPMCYYIICFSNTIFMIRSDNEPEFITSILDELYQITGTRRLRTTAYKPSSNSSECSHSTIHSLIAKMVDKHSQWSQYIDYVAAAYNRTIHKAAQFVPNQI